MTFNPGNITYKEMIATGNIGLIKSTDLKNEIIRYYHPLERHAMITLNNNSNLVDGNYCQKLFSHSLFVEDMDVESGTTICDSIFGNESLKGLHSTSDMHLSDLDNQLNMFNLVQFRKKIAKNTDDR